MATTLTPNLKLKINSDASPDLKYNFNRLDQLAASISVNLNQQVVIRSAQDIRFIPNSSDIGGTGSAGVVEFGDVNSPVAELKVNSDSTSFSGPITFNDIAIGGTKKLSIVYNSTITGSVDTLADRSIFIDAQGADRNLILGSNLELAGTSIKLTSPSNSDITLPLTGTLATIAGEELLTNKSFNFLSLKSGSHYINLTAPIGLSETLTLALPTSYGTNGQVLQTDGSGNLSWASATSSSLSVLTDVNLSSLADKNQLVYDNVSSKWVNKLLTFTTTWLPGDGLVKTVNHNLNSKQIIVRIIDESDNDIEIDSITRLNFNSVQLSASNLPTSGWQILISLIM